MTVRGSVPLKPERPKPESRQETQKLSSATLLLIGKLIQPLFFGKDDHAPYGPAFIILDFRKRAKQNFSLISCIPVVKKDLTRIMRNQARIVMCHIKEMGKGKEIQRFNSLVHGFSEHPVYLHVQFSLAHQFLRSLLNSGTTYSS